MHDLLKLHAHVTCYLVNFGVALVSLVSCTRGRNQQHVLWYVRVMRRLIGLRDFVKLQISHYQYIKGRHFQQMVGV